MVAMYSVNAILARDSRERKPFSSSRQETNNCKPFLTELTLLKFFLTQLSSREPFLAQLSKPFLTQLS
jgi:hypothetical protein